MTLPPDFVVRLNDRTTLIDDGAALIGGSPTRYVRLSTAAHGALRGREVDATTAVGAALADKLLDLAMAEPVLERLPAIDAEYTIVIPVMNRAAALERLLTSVRESTFDKHPRVIVVDDASGNPDEIFAIAQKFSAELVKLSVNVGPGGARNAGLAQVRTEFVVFLDSDLVINAEMVPTLLRHFVDPKVAIAVPRVRGLRHESNWIGLYEDSKSSLDLGATAGAVKPRSPIAWASSAAMVARVSALGEGFDPDMRVGEDVDLLWRVSEAGWRIRYEPAATTEHEHRVTFTQWFARKAYYGSGAVPLAQRHPQAIAPAVMSPWSVGIMAALLAQRKWSLPVAIVIALVTAYRSSKQLSSVGNPSLVAAELTAQGIAGAAKQTSSLILRHWWPVTVAVSFFSRRIRRAAAVLAVVDAVVEFEKTPTELDLVRFGVAKRLDDIAYGSGVWLASLRAGTLAALKPDWSPSKN